VYSKVGKSFKAYIGRKLKAGSTDPEFTVSNLECHSGCTEQSCCRLDYIGNHYHYDTDQGITQAPEALDGIQVYGSALSTAEMLEIFVAADGE
jgi:hypothetical protein